jgi:tetratricopeptide (TPR) repeat protein
MISRLERHYLSSAGSLSTPIIVTTRISLYLTHIGTQAENASARCIFLVMYSVREVCAVLGISVARLRSYFRSGLVVPSRDERGQIRLSFQDLVFLRRAEGLVAERIPPRRVHVALRALAERYPDGAAADLRLHGEGTQVVVDDGNMRWHATSGQTLFDFGERSVGDAGASITPLAHKRPAHESASGATLTTKDIYARACALEETSPQEAETAYRSVLEREPEFADAHVNLGRILHESGDVYAALVHYRAALAIRPHDATAAFNVGVALEDLGASVDAIAAYRQSIETDARNPDAHYNLARLLEQSGKPDLAVRHLLLYRQLVKKR